MDCFYGTVPDRKQKLVVYISFVKGFKDIVRVEAGIFSAFLIGRNPVVRKKAVIIGTDDKSLKEILKGTSQMVVLDVNNRKTIPNNLVSVKKVPANSFKKEVFIPDLKINRTAIN